MYTGKAQQISREHPTLMQLLFRNIKGHLPFGTGEGKVKDVLAENIPDWTFDLSESDLREFMEIQAALILLLENRGAERPLSASFQPRPQEQS